MPRLLTHILGVALLGIPLALNAQMRPREFNVGVSWGYGGVHSYFMPAVDLSYRGTWLRTSWTPAVFSTALYQDIWSHSNTGTELVAVWLSGGYMRTNENWVLEVKSANMSLSPLPVDGFKILCGPRIDFMERLSIRCGIGIASNHRRDTGNFRDERRGKWRVWPNLEAGIGFCLFPTIMEGAK